jgi:hypothetical protein
MAKRFGFARGFRASPCDPGALMLRPESFPM